MIYAQMNFIPVGKCHYKHKQASPGICSRQWNHSQKTLYGCHSPLSLSLPLTLTRVYQSICIISFIIYVYLHQFDKRQCFDGKQRTTTNMNDEMVTLLLHLSIYHSVCVCCYLSEASINLFVFSALFMWLFSVPEHITHIMLLQTEADPEEKRR